VSCYKPDRNQFVFGFITEYNSSRLIFMSCPSFKSMESHVVGSQLTLHAHQSFRQRPEVPSCRQAMRTLVFNDGLFGQITEVIRFIAWRTGTGFSHDIPMRIKKYLEGFDVLACITKGERAGEGRRD